MRPGTCNYSLMHVCVFALLHFILCNNGLIRDDLKIQLLWCIHTGGCAEGERAFLLLSSTGRSEGHSQREAQTDFSREEVSAAVVGKSKKGHMLNTFSTNDSTRAFLI